MNNSDIVHMADMATTQPSSTGWTSERLKVLFWSPSRKWNYYPNTAQPLGVYKSNMLWTGFVVTLLTLSSFRQVENAMKRVSEPACSNFYFIGNYSFTNTWDLTISSHVVQGCKEFKQALTTEISFGCGIKVLCSLEFFGIKEAHNPVLYDGNIKKIAKRNCQSYLALQQKWYIFFHIFCS